MKARTWFEARGRSLRSRGYTWSMVKGALRLYELPRWAQSAVARGHLNQTPGVALDGGTKNGD